MEWRKFVVVPMQFVAWLLTLHMVLRVREPQKRSTVSAHSVVIGTYGKNTIVCHSNSATQKPSKTENITLDFFVGSSPYLKHIRGHLSVTAPDSLFFLFRALASMISV